MDRYIVDNTIYDVFGGINVSQDDAVISGNIISDIDPSDYHISIFSPAGSTSIDNNLFYDPDNTILFRWIGNTYSDLSSFQAATSQCPNCEVNDPLFNNTGQNDLHLQYTSPARDKSHGKHAVYDTFFARYGIDIAKDYQGTARPRRSGWDYGASESIPSPFPVSGSN